MITNPVRLLGLLALVAGICALAGRSGAASGQAAATIPDFYDPPSPLAAGRPGDLIGSMPIDAPPGMKAWRILYHSTGLDDADTAVSGMLAVPDGPAPSGGLPLLTVAHGTTGAARACAPSIDPLASGGNQDTPAFFGVIGPYVQAGWAVVATDYQGLGAPGLPSYLIGAITGQNVLDAARAAQGFEEIKLSDAVVIWGHSEGGQAAAFAAQLAPSYAPDLQIAGVVEVAPVAELSLMASGLYGIQQGTSSTGFIMIVAYAWNLTYGAPLDVVLTPATIGEIGVAGEQCYEEVIDLFRSMPPRAYLSANPAQTAPWSQLLTENTPAAEKLAVPALVVQGLADTTIPSAVTQIYVKNLCGAGAAVQYDTYAGADHSGVLTTALPDVLAWMTLARHGEAPSNCAGG